MISSQLADDVPLPVFSSSATDHETSRIAFFVKTVELYEIVNRTLLTLYQEKGPKKSSNESDQGTTNLELEELCQTIRLEESLSQWQSGLPAHLAFDTLSAERKEMFQRQTVVLHTR